MKHSWPENILFKLRNKNECGNDDGEIRLSFSNDI